MEVKRFWSVALVLLSIHGGSDSTTETMVTDFSTFTGVTLETVMPTDRTPPPPPPSIPPPPPTFDTVDPTPEPTPTPPSGTRTPPPPPPPSPPPPPPSTIAPPLTTPPPTEFATTVAIEPTTVTPEPTERRQTEPRATEPNPTEGSNPIAEKEGKISVVVSGSTEEFDRQNFKEVIAEQTNMYCGSNEGACKGGTVTVGPEDVIIVAVTDYEDPVATSRRRRRLLATQTQVDYYVQDPINSNNVMLTSAQQEAFLTDEEVVQNLEENIGFVGMPEVVTEPPPTLEPWEIALIVIGSVAGLALVAGGIGYYMSRSKNPADELDLELQQKLPVEEFTDVREGNDYSTVPASNGGSELPKKKAPVDEVDVSTQVKFNEILSETGYRFAKQQATDDGPTEPSPAANGGNSIVVTAEISSSSSSSTSSQHDESEQIATAEDQQVIPPEYEEVQEKAAKTSKPTAPANDAAPKEESTKTADEEAGEAVSELTNLVADEAKGEKSGHDNPGFTVTTEVDEHNIAKTVL